MLFGEDVRPGEKGYEEEQARQAEDARSRAARAKVEAEPTVFKWDIGAHDRRVSA